MPVKLISISMENNQFFARVDGGPKFFVGKKVKYGDGFGLANATFTATTPKYDPAQHRDKHGFWADFIFPTSQCESRGVFHCINSYDRARFTFSFLQYAAHVANGDFVKFFRKLLALNSAADYFPDLTLKDNVIHRITETGLVRLEEGNPPLPLMNYLNPSLNEVEEIEAINAAKFVHWADNDPEHQRLQVEIGVRHFSENMKLYSDRYGLNGRGDKVCLVVADIRHQGRAKSSVILAALNTGGDDEKAFKNLLEIGEEVYPGRIETLRKTINKSVAEGILGKRKYDREKGEFVL